MTTVAIPAWNASGLLPPVNPDLPASPDRSPYAVSLKDLVMRFATTVQRQAVLKGLLDYRAELHRLGITQGFQWLDGSFLENIELLEQRAPRDIDVVSFISAPAAMALTEQDALLFDQANAKARFMVDAYVVELDQVTQSELALWSAYWYSMWSHRRNQVWKGFLQIDLAATEDSEARSLLAQSIEMAG